LRQNMYKEAEVSESIFKFKSKYRKL